MLTLFRFKSKEDLPTAWLVITIFSLFMSLQGPVGRLFQDYNLLLIILINQLGILTLPVAVVVCGLKLNARRLFPLIPVTQQSWYIIIGITILVVVLSDFALEFTETLLPVPESLRTIYSQILAVHSPAEFIQKFLLLCVLPAVVEELFFRGFCQVSLAQYMSPRAAVMLAALLFALAHGTIWYLHLFFALGCFLGWLALRCRSLWPAMVAHLLNNSWTFVSHAAGWSIIPSALWLRITVSASLVIVLGLSIRRWQLYRMPSQNTPFARPGA